MSVGSVFGEFTELSHEWRCGVLETIVDSICGVDVNTQEWESYKIENIHECEHWILFDGPVDPLW